MIFHGHYVFRTLNGVLAILSGLVASAFSATIAVLSAKTGEDLLSQDVASGFVLGILLFGMVGLRFVWAWVRNRRVLVEINEEGIIHGKRFWPWDGIQAFVGTRYGNGVCLEFTPRYRGVWGGGHLQTTPLLDDEQYVELARELAQSISQRFPHVIVRTHPENASAGS